MAQLLSREKPDIQKPPTKEFYGYEALFMDDSGNWFSLGQKKQVIFPQTNAEEIQRIFAFSSALSAGNF